jgi:hypothetical protein
MVCLEIPPPNLDSSVTAGPGPHRTLLIRRPFQDPGSTSLVYMLIDSFRVVEPISGFAVFHMHILKIGIAFALSKTTKTKAYLTIFVVCTLSCAYWVGRHWWLFSVSSRVSLFMNTDPNSYHDPEKNSETWNYIPSLSFCLRSERRSSKRIFPKYSLWTKAEERRRDMDSCLAVLSWSG